MTFSRVRGPASVKGHPKSAKDSYHGVCAVTLVLPLIVSTSQLFLGPALGWANWMVSRSWSQGGRLACKRIWGPHLPLEVHADVVQKRLPRFWVGRPGVTDTHGQAGP